jgi:hypothetical protein
VHNLTSFRSNDYSKLFLNINTKSFVLKADDNEIELNVKSEKSKIVSKDAALKSLITTSAIACDLYQKMQKQTLKEVHKTQ